jgi:MazG family protein
VSTARDPDLGRLQRIMARLRAPDGCPWDREQSLETLRHYLLEESYEVLEVMTGARPEEHCEELGDLLLQIAFQSQIRSETNNFQLADVVDSICHKMLRRHPHVFGEEDAQDAAAVSSRWEEIKLAEGKRGGPSDVSRQLPALMRAEKIGSKAAKLGFDWPDIAGPIAKVREELAEVEGALGDGGDRERLHAELGDLLFAVVNVARHLEVRPEQALHHASDRVTRRVEGVV